MASTYVNDLRLNEMATGDGSGTWGTTTNTNLELIAEAFSYGTEVITTNADTHTTTIADGATDPGRSLYLKYTGTLDSACTITIGPDTVSKVWIIENGTSGSQNIIISQGSGADITIPAGDTKVVYSDGAGAGAAFFDAFASLSVVDLKVQDDLTVTGDIDVDGTTNLDVVDIDGALTQDGGAVFNETGADVDFRVESDTNTHALFVQGSDGYVGIGVTPTHNFNLQSAGAVEARFRSTDGDCSLQISSDTDEGQDSELVFMSGTSGRGSIVYDHNTTAASQAMIFKTGDNAVSAMTIDGSGSVGIGVVPSSWAANTLDALEIGESIGVGNLTARVDGINAVGLGLNWYYGGGATNTYVASSFATNYSQEAGTHRWFHAASGTAGAALTFTESMRIAANGNVGIGTSSPTQKFVIQGISTAASAFSLIVADSVGTDLFNIRNDGAIFTGGGANSPRYLTTATAANLVVETDGYLYKSTSSRRYKNTITDATHGLTELLTLRPVTYKGNGKIDGDTVFGGLIAEEVHDAGLTEFVVYNEENEPDALAYSNMVSLCVKAIQEQQTINRVINGSYNNPRRVTGA
jgi:hypothetical protein